MVNYIYRVPLLYLPPPTANYRTHVDSQTVASFIRFSAQSTVSGIYILIYFSFSLLSPLQSIYTYHNLWKFDLLLLENYYIIVTKVGAERLVRSIFHYVLFSCLLRYFRRFEVQFTVLLQLSDCCKWNLLFSRITLVEFNVLVQFCRYIVTVVIQVYCILHVNWVLIHKTNFDCPVQFRILSYSIKIWIEPHLSIQLFEVYILTS